MTVRFLKSTFTALLLMSLSAVPALAGMGGGGSGGEGMDSGSAGAGMGQSSGSGTMSGGEAGPGAPMASLPRDEVTTGDMQRGGVRMDIQPESYENGRLVVRFYANTHAENLGNHNLMEQAHLEYGGHRISPEKVDRMRGHHAGGRMVFEAPGLTGEFSIVIEGIPNEPRRVFAW